MLRHFGGAREPPKILYLFENIDFAGSGRDPSRKMRLEKQRRKHRFSSNSEPSGHVLWHFFVFGPESHFFVLIGREFLKKSGSGPRVS